MWAIAAEVELFRWHWSLDFDDMIALLVAVGGVLGVILIRRSQTQSSSVEQHIDDGVLGRFEKYIEEVAELRVTVEYQAAELIRLREALTERAKLEEYLRGEIHARDAIIDRRDEEIAGLRARVRHLEDLCRRAGLNGDT